MADVSDSKPAREKPAKESVFLLSRQSRCYGCDKKLMPGDLVKLRSVSEEREVFCRTCSKLDCLEILLAGNAKVTRLAKKYSSVDFPIMQWSDLWKCYKRVGVLVESQAIEKANAECAPSDNA